MQVECVRAAWAAGRAGAAGRSVGARAFVPAGVRVGAAAGCPGGAVLSWRMLTPGAGPGRSRPVPSRNPARSRRPHPRPASPLRRDRDPPLGSSKARQDTGRPWRLPAGPLAARGRAGRGGSGERSAKILQQPQRRSRDPPSPSPPCAVRPLRPLPLRAPPRPLSLQLRSRFLTPPPGPLAFFCFPGGPSAGSVSLTPSTLLPFPSRRPLLFSCPGVPGQGLRAGQWR